MKLAKAKSLRFIRLFGQALQRANSTGVEAEFRVGRFSLAK
jgi:hypothetical protein